MPTFDDALAAEYAHLWDSATILPANAQAVANTVAKLMTHKSSYDQVEAATSVKWYVIGIIHYRESDFDMGTHLHNGDPLTARTVQVPRGRPLQGNPPFKWVDSAIDALTMMNFQNVKNWTIERIAFQLERYNGWGYRSRHVNSPYLWSFTNQYKGGLFVGDHKFDPTAMNKAAGGMALLKQLIANGTVQVPRQSETGPAKPPPPPPVPVDTGLFVADGEPFKLADAPNVGAHLGFFVTTTMPIRKLKEVDATWWQIEATAPDNVKHAGFTKGAWLKSQKVMSTFDEDLFTEACLNEARVQGSSAPLLIALADAESGVQNKVSEGTGGRFGPFALSEADWTANNDAAKTGYGDEDRFDPIAQAAVATTMVVKLTTDLQGVLPDKALPTYEQLYLGRIFGAKGVPALMSAADGATVRDSLTAASYTADQLDQIFATRPSLLTAGIKVSDLRSAVQAKLDAGLERAVADISTIEPDLVVGPQPASAPDAGSVPWMEKAQAELAAGITAANNPQRVSEYLAATTLGPGQPASTAWCAAFVSWCIKQSGKTDKVKVFSARAADWLQNGDKLPGPQFGAVGITKPLVQGDSGHVGFITTFDGNRIHMLGGNQGHHVVSEVSFPIGDFVGYRMM